MSNKPSADKKLITMLNKNLEKCLNNTKKLKTKEKNLQNPRTNSKPLSTKSRTKWTTNNSSNTSKNPKNNTYSNLSNNNNNGTMIQLQTISTIMMNIPKFYSNLLIKSRKESMNTKAVRLMSKKHNIQSKSIEN